MGSCFEDAPMSAWRTGDLRFSVGASKGLSEGRTLPRHDHDVGNVGWLVVGQSTQLQLDGREVRSVSIGDGARPYPFVTPIGQSNDDGHQFETLSGENILGLI